jgi:hypothetical protein
LKSYNNLIFQGEISGPDRDLEGDEIKDIRGGEIIMRQN